jgi:hypothetical protein
VQTFLLRKTISITCYKCVFVALITKHTIRMRRMIFVACPALPDFYTLSHKQHNKRENLLNVKCVFCLSLQIVSETFPILRKIQRGTVICVPRSSCKVPVVRIRFKRNLNFLDGNLEKYCNNKFHENPCIGSRCMRTEGPTDLTKLIVAFRNLAQRA